MKLDIAGYEAIEMLEKYYTDFKWPVTRFSFTNMYSVSGGGDGSYSVVWDIIDLENDKLYKADQFYDAENGGFTHDGEEWSEEFDAIQDKTSTYGGKVPTAISVDELIDAVLLAELNARGHNRSLGRNSDGSEKFQKEGE
jgi:hypothetical protein